MKRLFNLLLLCVCALGANAQTVSYTENTSLTLYSNPTTYNNQTAYYRIPAITKLSNGNLLGISDLRIGGATDVGNSNVVTIIGKQSSDNGKTWDSNFSVIVEGKSSQSGYNHAHGDAAVVTDSETGKILLLCANGQTAYASGGCLLGRYYSSDNGATWTGGEITSTIKSICSSIGVTSHFFTSGRIIQSSKVKVGSSYRVYSAMCTNKGSVVMYSDDFGANWAVLGGASAYSGGNETVLEELPNGDLLLSARLNSGNGRAFNVFKYSNLSTGTGSWQTGATASTFSSAANANGELLLIPTSKSNYYILLQSLALSGRQNVTVYYKVINTDSDSYSTVSYYNTGWKTLKQMSSTTSCYSTMVLDKDGNVAYLFEDNNNSVNGVETYNIKYRNFTVNVKFDDDPDPEPDPSVLSDAIAGTDNFSTSNPTLSVNDSGNSTIAQSGTSYVVQNTTNSLSQGGGSSYSRTYCTVAMVIDFPTTLTEGNIFTMSTAGTITANGSIGLAVNSSGKLQGKYKNSSYYSNACSQQYTGKHVVIVTVNDNGTTIYVDGSTATAQASGLKVSNLWQYMTIDAAYASYIKSFYVFNSDKTSDLASIYAALTAEPTTTYTVTCSQATGGKVTASPASAAAGTEVTLTVTPDAGYELNTLSVKDASGNAVAVSNNKFTMPASNVTVTATFNALPTYTVTCNEASNGKVTASPASAAAGVEVTLTATPADGYSLSSLVVKDASGNSVTVANNKFTMPASNVTVTATFAEAPKSYEYIVDAKNGTFGHNSCTSTSSSYCCKWTSNLTDPVTLTLSCLYPDRTSSSTNVNINNMKSNSDNTSFVAYSANANSSSYTAKYKFTLDSDDYVIVSYSFDYTPNSASTVTVLGNDSTAYASGATANVNENTAQFYIQGATSTIDYVTISNFKVVIAPKTGSFSISEYEWATFYLDAAFTMPAGVKGVVVNVENNKMKLVDAYAEGDVVPANTPLLLNGAEGTYTYSLASSTESAPEGNYLRGMLTAGNITAEPSGSYYYYTLTTGTDQTSSNYGKIGFYWGEQNGGVFAIDHDNSAYLVLPQSINPAKGYAFDDNAKIDIEFLTRLIDALINKTATGSYYDVNGDGVVNKADIEKAAKIILSE